MSFNIIGIVFLVIFAIGVIAFRQSDKNYRDPVVNKYMKIYYNVYDIYVWIKFIGAILLISLIFIFGKRK